MEADLSSSLVVTFKMEPLTLFCEVNSFMVYLVWDMNIVAATTLSGNVFLKDARSENGNNEEKKCAFYHKQ